MDKTLLEVSRLEKRLTKLTQILTSSPPEPKPSPSSIMWSFSAGKNQRKQLEQSVVTWEDDASVAHCPFCQQEFSTYTFRRHHCRLCGRVVCGDPLTDCSTEVGLNVTSGTENLNTLCFQAQTDLSRIASVNRESRWRSRPRYSNVQGMQEDGIQQAGFRCVVSTQASRCPSI